MSLSVWSIRTELALLLLLHYFHLATQNSKHGGNRSQFLYSYTMEWRSQPLSSTNQKWRTHLLLNICVVSKLFRGWFLHLCQLWENTLCHFQMPHFKCSLAIASESKHLEHPQTCPSSRRTQCYWTLTRHQQPNIDLRGILYSLVLSRCLSWTILAPCSLHICMRSYLWRFWGYPWSIPDIVSSLY